MSTEFVCKHCGSEKFSAEVSAHGTSRGDIGVRNGKPYFDVSWNHDFVDVDEDYYFCEGCDASASKFEDLVTEKRAGQLTAPCGRCDHSVTDHSLEDSRSYPKHFVRAAMPCTVEGCDCHDYYDLAIANHGITLEVAA